VANKVKECPREAGFTLIEVMIVVVIVGILAAIAYPSYLEHVRNTREAEAKGQIMEYASALEAFRAKTFAYPVDDAAARALAPDELYGGDFYTPVYSRDSSHAFTITATPKGIMTGEQTLEFETVNGGPQWAD
jgi:type IV pilus assembly protein PilE